MMRRSHALQPLGSWRLMVGSACVCVCVCMLLCACVLVVAVAAGGTSLFLRRYKCTSSTARRWQTIAGSGQQHEHTQQNAQNASDGHHEDSPIRPISCAVTVGCGVLDSICLSYASRARCIFNAYFEHINALALNALQHTHTRTHIRRPTPPFAHARISELFRRNGVHV